jgi:hypothetical protein
MAEIEKTVIAQHDDIFKRMPGNQPEKQPDPNAAPVTDTPPAQQAAPKTDNPPAVDPPVPEAAKVNLDELSDDDFLELYQKRTGKKAKSLDDLKEPPKPPTKEELEAAAEREQTESLEWALSTGKVKREDYDKAVVAKQKDNRTIALALFTEELQAEDKNITPEECEERFGEFYAEAEDENSWKRIRAIKQMNKVADEYRAQFSAIDNLPEEYRAERTATQLKANYAKGIKEIIKASPKEISFPIPYTNVDGSETTLEYKVPVPEKIFKQVTELLTSDGMENGKLGTSKPDYVAAEVAWQVRARMIDEAVPVIMAEHAKKVEEDLMVNLKNARNPQQSLAQRPAEAPKTTPNHDAVFNKMKIK